MGGKNNRGQPKLVPMSVKLAQEKNTQKEQIAAEKSAGHQKWLANRAAWQKLQLEKKAAWEKLQFEKKKVQEQKLAQKEINEESARKVAATMQFKCIQKHYALVLKQNGDDKQLVIDLNFLADPPTDMLALLKVLPEYSAAITKVQVKLIQPMQHGSREIYNQRVQNMNKLIEQLNIFPLTELNVLVDVDSDDNFHQFKLAAAFNGLNFEDWTMDFQIMAGSDRYPIDRYSSYGKRLRGFYRAEF
ncbi:hypothetical protein BPAE_0092g00410 [Botrytis paeoniae]|uniref:Uncharacterized protein n=1 Tax=Botrytis paeoniae TaxID=278948 RepID=A0A4Z1FPZ0_9HELO|nr:hypothetical protein BPAE_0092g00410 [Botrytis paeoniae]